MQALEVRAGKMRFSDGMLRPDDRKGLLKLFVSPDDQLTHLTWTYAASPALGDCDGIPAGVLLPEQRHKRALPGPDIPHNHSRARDLNFPADPCALLTRACADPESRGLQGLLLLPVPESSRAVSECGA